MVKELDILASPAKAILNTPIKSIFDAYETYQREKTNRAEIRARKEVEVKRIEEMAQCYIKTVEEVFNDRKNSVNMICKLANEKEDRSELLDEIETMSEESKLRIIEKMVDADKEKKLQAMENIVELAKTSPKEMIDQVMHKNLPQ